MPLCSELARLLDTHSESEGRLLDGAVVPRLGIAEASIEPSR